MSDIGVYSSVYQRVRGYGQLIDEVLLGLRSNASSPVDGSRRRLGGLLVGVAATPPPDLRAAWLAMLIGGGEPSARAEWARVGRALLGAAVEVDVIRKLEELAARLEDRRTDALGKMRGLRA